MERKKLGDSVREAAAAAQWVEATDGAAVDLALTYADRMDKAGQEFDAGEIDSTSYTKALYLGPHLLSTLKALGMTPAERKAIIGDAPRKASPVDELKKKRRLKAAGE